MAVHLRLTRAGRHKLPFFRLVAADSRMPRDGRYLEVLGTYDPLKNPPVTQFKQERVLDWLGPVAQRRARAIRGAEGRDARGSLGTGAGHGGEPGPGAWRVLCPRV
ncbi:MAG: 30S ribosomal protein S16 [Nitrospirae bacterium]|nr:MAG: 30S ribosomal protein S16 [Nitrospirota bacterium]